MRAKELRKLLSCVVKEVQAEINGNASSGGLYARGLSTEGYAGGYREALYDVMTMLDHGRPSDNRGYWQRASKQNREDLKQ